MSKKFEEDDKRDRGRASQASQQNDYEYFSNDIYRKWLQSDDRWWTILTFGSRNRCIDTKPNMTNAFDFEVRWSNICYIMFC